MFAINLITIKRIRFTVGIIVLLISAMFNQGISISNPDFFGPQRVLAAPPADQKIDVVGHLGGESIGPVAVQGNYAYVGQGPELAVIDISQPVDPQRVGYIVFDALIWDVALAGNYAYVADSDAGLRVVDISAPTNPTEVGSLTAKYAQYIEVSGNYAYLVGGDTVMIIDITDPTQPTPVGSIEGIGVIQDLAVAGNYMYFLTSELIPSFDYIHALRVVDISTPTNPTEVGAYTAFLGVTSLAVGSGGYVFVTTGRSGLRVIDVKTPTNPTEVGFYDPPDPSIINDVAIVGNFAYLADLDYKMRIVDISVSTAPTEVGQYIGATAVRHITVSGNYAYVIDFNADLTIVNISNPTNPVVTGYYHAPKYAVDVAVDGAYLYVAEAASGSGDYRHDQWGLRIFDMSNPVNPVQVSFLHTPDFPGRVVVSNGYAYVLGLSSLAGDLWIIDVRDPTNPIYVGSYAPPKQPSSSLAVSGNYVYIGDGSHGLRIVDVSNPANPIEVGFYFKLGDEVAGVKVIGRYAYVTGEGLHVMDVRNSNSPVIIGGFNANISGRIEIKDKYAYVANWNDLRVIDISNSNNISQVGFYEAPQYDDVPDGKFIDIAVGGGYAYVADEYYGVRVFDVTPPSSPTEVSLYKGVLGSSETAKPEHIVVADGNIYVAGSGHGVFILRYLAEATFTPAQGGTLTYTDANDLTTTLELPPNAVSAPTTITLSPLPSVTPRPHLAFTGHAFDLAASQNGIQQSNFSFAAPVTITIQYADADIQGITDEGELTVQLWHNDNWVDAATTCTPASTYSRDPVNNTISVSVCHLSRYALFGPALPTFFPFIGDHF